MCSKLNIELHEGLIWIGDHAYNHCSSSPLTKITIPSTVVQIGGREFVGNNNDNNILPSHVFYNLATTTLQEFEVAEGNEHFVTHEGVLYTKDYKILIAYPPAKTTVRYEIPEGCIDMGELSFSRAHFIKTLALPNSYIVKDEFSQPDNSSSSVAEEYNANCLSAAIYRFTSIEKFDVKDTNPNYAVDENGILYSKDYTSVICIAPACCKNSTIVLHENVTNIDMVILLGYIGNDKHVYNGQVVGKMATAIVFGPNLTTISDNALTYINHYNWTITCSSPNFNVVNGKLTRV